MAANFPLFPKPDAPLPSSFLFPTEEADGTRDNVSAERERERERKGSLSPGRIMTRPFDLSRATPWPEDLPFHAADLYSNSRPGRCSARGILWISSPLNIYAILLLLFVSRCEIFCKGCWRNSFNCTGEGSLIPRLRGLFSSPDYFFQSNGDGKEYRLRFGRIHPSP